MSEKNITQRKILVAIDGSVYSSNALKYLISLFQNDTTINFHLFSDGLCGSAPSAGREWMDELSLMNAVNTQCRNNLSRAHRVVEEAKQQMIRSGFPEERITTSAQLMKVGAAADILQLARNGMYDGLVIGRRGISKIEELFMGSISASLLAKCHDIPIWIVDKQNLSNKFLVPVDGAFHSLKAVDHLAYILGTNPDAEITLFHSSAMFAAKYTVDPQNYYDQWGKEWCDKYLAGENAIYEAPRQILIEAGFPEDKIDWQHASKGIEPSRQIIRQALVNDYGTIVMGRRGEDSKRGLFKSVSDRVVFMADQVAIWIVG